jgi:hypothetical protein
MSACVQFDASWGFRHPVFQPIASVKGLGSQAAQSFPSPRFRC